MINFDFVIEDIEDNDTGKQTVFLGIEKVEKDDMSTPKFGEFVF